MGALIVTLSVHHCFVLSLPPDLLTFFADTLHACACRSGIADVNKFTNAPLLLMYGFMCVAATAAIWDNLATYFSLPVSTTHTTGGITHLHSTLCAPLCAQLHAGKSRAAVVHGTAAENFANHSLTISTAEPLWVIVVSACQQVAAACSLLCVGVTLRGQCRAAALVI